MKKKEKTLRDHLTVIEILFVVGFIIMNIPIFFQNDLWTGVFMFLGFGIMVAACIYRNKHFKCPHCEGKLHIRGIPQYCPHCGEKLNPFTPISR